MSDSERITPLLSLPFNSFLMLRLEYALLTGNDLQAMLLRIIEKRMDDQRRHLYRERMNARNGTVPPEAVLDIARDVWVPISHAAFLYDLYGLVLSENTLKKALQELRKRQLIFTRKGQGRYAPDEYQLNLKLLHEEFQSMQQQGKAGYQPLTPSEVETLMASSEDQTLTPSESQKLTPCKTVRGSKVDPLRVSELDPSNREITEERLREEAAEESDGPSPSEEVTPTAPAADFSVGESFLSSQEEPASSPTSLPSGPPTMPPSSVAPKAKDEPLLPEALVALVERLLGAPYDASARAYQLEAARALLAMKLVADLSTLERVYAACYDDWWRQHYGKMHLTHLVEREKSGQPRIVRLLARLTPAPASLSVSSSVSASRAVATGSQRKEDVPDPWVKQRERASLEKLLRDGDQLVAELRASSDREAERFAAALQFLRQQQAQGGIACNG